MRSRPKVVLGGYDISEVDALLRQADDALASGRETLRAQARQAIRSAEFRRRTRGYARRQVKDLVRQRMDALTTR